MPPVTNLYKGSDGRHFLVTVVDPDALAGLSRGLARASHVQPVVEVFLSDETGTVIDYDGDPANGMTPILSNNSRSFAGYIDSTLTTHADALAALGYQLADE